MLSHCFIICCSLLTVLAINCSRMVLDFGSIGIFQRTRTTAQPMCARRPAQRTDTLPLSFQRQLKLCSRRLPKLQCRSANVTTLFAYYQERKQSLLMCEHWLYIRNQNWTNYLIYILMPARKDRKNCLCFDDFHYVFDDHSRDRTKIQTLHSNQFVKCTLTALLKLQTTYFVVRNTGSNNSQEQSRDKGGTVLVAWCFVLRCYELCLLHFTVN